MINRILLLSSLFFLFSCGGIEFVFKESSLPNQLRDKTIIVFEGNKEEKFAREMFAFFGNEIGGEYILATTFFENKENRLVKQNQVAQKIDYELSVTYQLFDKNQNCKIHNKKIITKFSFVPKSFGYNFGTDRSLERLYARSVKRNIQSFIDSIPQETACLR